MIKLSIHEKKESDQKKKYVSANSIQSIQIFIEIMF